MSDLMINLDTAALPPPPPTKKRPEAGNTKHQRFVRRRHFLEQKGFLRQKQLPSQPPCPKRDASHGRTAVAADIGKKRQKVDRRGGPAHRGGHAFQMDASTCRAKVPPRENCSRCPTDAQPARPPWGASDKGGGGPARQNGALPPCSLRDIPRITHCSAFESSLPSGSPKPTKTVAIDCEMVGTGPGGRNSDLARCSVVGYEGDVIYDKYVRPPSPITNYRTRWSGIRRHHMANAVPFKVAQKEILKLLSGKIVVGHAIHNDFKALKYFHPKALTRDTSKIPLLNRRAGFPENEAASLKRLTKQLLHRDIQVGQNGHSSVEDARATMELYRVVEAEWERLLATAPAQN